MKPLMNQPTSEKRNRSEQPLSEWLLSGRFSMLHHRVGPALHRTSHNHFDWLFEGSDGLITWSVDESCLTDSAWRPGQRPWRSATIEIPVTRLADHRRVYLEREGSLSKDRGTVMRVEEGRYELVDASADSIALHWTALDERGCQDKTWEGTLQFQRIRGPDSPGDDNIAWRLLLRT